MKHRFRSVLVLALAAAACGNVRVVDTDTGDASTDAANDSAGANAAPVVTVVSPKADALLAVGSKVVFEATVTDDKDAGDQLSFAWTTNTLTTALASGKVPTDGKLKLETAELAPGPHLVKLAVTDSAGLVGSAEVKVYLDTAPTAPKISISPAKPTSADDLTVVIDEPATDIDRAPGELTYTYVWTKNGVAAGVTDKTVPASLTAKGETWAVTVKANDPLLASPQASAQVVVGNAAPVLLAAEVSPAKVDLLTDVTCALPTAPTDADGDKMTIKYTWLIGSYANPGVTEATVKVADLAAGKDESGKDIPVKAGDTVSCSVVVGDGDATSPPVAATPVTVEAVDICSGALNPCALAADCSNTGTLVPTCSCKQGYGGDGYTCFDLDECATGVAGCSPDANCENSVGGFTCTCNQGFSGDGLACADVDECANNQANCDLAADCSNTVGGFVCTCQPGYSGDGKSCIDIDECLTGAAACDLNATCQNSVGSYACACKPGYGGDGKSCIDIDECATGANNCATAATCSNTPGSFTCACKPGYTGDGTTCADIDECAAVVSPCAAEAVCSNSPGSFSCACKSGYTGDGKQCADINECATNNGGCNANATCANTPGSFACACKPGYSGDGKTCTDVNECLTNNGGCVANGDPAAKCVNLVGSFQCTCGGPTFVLSSDKKTCVKSDPCTATPAPCDASALCSVVSGAAKCSCATGFTLKADGKSCADVDECLTNNGGCNANATCANTTGSFTCTCKAGFTGDGKTCADVNECLVNNGGCNANAACTNTVGSNTCACKAGFTGDGKTCTDVNECLLNNGGCSANATCTNTPGSSTCACKAGFTGDGKTCVDINECSSSALNKCAAGTATCTNSVGSYTCACNAGYAGDGFTCTDVNECTGKNNCNVNANCTNTPGSFTCACKSGFIGNGTTLCFDADECGAVNLWSTNFASPPAGWTLDAPSVANTAVKWQFAGGVLRYGDVVKNNFDTPNAANKGNATSPTFTLSSKPFLKLQFEADLQTEFGPTYDKLFVQLIVDGQVVAIWDKSKQISGSGYQKYSLAVANAWPSKTVQLRFAFDTGDAVGNGGQGVFIKNVSIVGAGNPCDKMATCGNTFGSFTCTCDAGYGGDGKTCLPIGSGKTAPAASCLDILTKLGTVSCPAGGCWLAFGGAAPAQYTCTTDGWTQMAFNNFEGGAVGAWTPPVTSSCTGNTAINWGGVYGGPSGAGAGFIGSWASNSLPTHTQIRVMGNYEQVDTWDGETGWLKVDGVQVWTSTAFTTAVASTSALSYCGNPGYTDGAPYLSATVAHTAAKVAVQVGSTLNQLANDESWAIDNVYVQVR